MGSARYIGRVGALAAALGVGLTVSLSTAVAWADNASSDASHTPSNPSSSSPGASNTESGTASLSAHPSSGQPAQPETKTAPDATAPTATRAKGRAKNVPPRNRSSNGKNSSRRPTRADNSTTSAADKPASTAATATAPTSTQATVAPRRVDSAPAMRTSLSPAAVPKVLTPVARLDALAVTATPVAVALAPAESVARSALAVLSRALLGVLPGGSPVATPLSWVASAAARRELGAVPVSAVTAAATTNQNPVLTTTAGTPNSTTGAVSGAVKVTDTEGDSVTVTVPATTDKGGAVVFDAATGKYTYSPSIQARHAASATGATTSDKQDTFTVTADDGHGGMATGVVTVAVKPVNIVPVKGTSTVQAPDSDGVLTGNLGVTDADADALTYTPTKPAKGTVTVNNDGSFTYTPTAAAMHAASLTTATASAKSDTFTVKVVDGHGGSVSQAVTVTVASANAAPVVTAGPTVTATNASTGVVTGRITATDMDNDTLKYAGTATKGKVSVSSTGVITYTPTAAARHAASVDGADTTDNVTVTVSDSHGGTVTETMSVSIVGKNAAATVTTTAGTPSAITGVVSGTVRTTDADKDPVIVAVDGTSAKGGTIVYNTSTGAYTYTPSRPAQDAASMIGATAADKTDTFTVTATDGHGGTTTTTVSVTVKPTPTVNTPDPTNGVVTGTVNVASPGGDTLTYTQTKPAKGTVTVNSDGTFTYTPTATAMHAASLTTASASAKSDTFTVKVTNTQGGSVTQAVTVPITPANVAPVVASGPTVTATNSSTGAVTGQITLTDADKDTLKYSGTATKGKVSISSTGVITYTPTAAARHIASADDATDADKTDTVTITVRDGHGGVLTESVQVSVTSGNVKPGSIAASVGTPDVSTGVSTGSVKAADADKDVLSYSATSSAKGGEVTIDSATGAFTYTPTTEMRNAAATTGASDEVKSDTFVARITDAHGGVVNVVVKVAVSPLAVPANFSPTDGSAAVNAPDPISGVVTGTFSATDANNDPLTYTVSVPAAKGSVIVTGAAFVYTPSTEAREQAASPTATASDAQDHFVASVSDGHGGTLSIPVIVAVAPALPTAVNILDNSKIDGQGAHAAINPSGTRAVVVSTTAAGNTNVTVYNTSTGAVVGAATLVASAGQASVQFNNSGTRAVVAVQDAGNASNSLAVFDTSTGAQVGTTIDLGPGNFTSGVFAGGPVLISKDGTRGLVVTSAQLYDESTGLTTNYGKVDLVNLTSGTSISETEMEGTPSATLSGDGSRVVITTLHTSAAPTSNLSDTTSIISFLDAATGIPVADQLSVTGVAYVSLNSDGSRAVIAAMTGSFDGTGSAADTLTTLTVVNTESGVQVGDPISFSDCYSAGLPIVVADGTRAVVTLFGSTAVDSIVTRYETGVVVVDMATGRQVGSTVLVGGLPETIGNGQFVIGGQMIANGTRVLVVSLNPNVVDATVASNVTLVDTVNGVQVGETASIDGFGYTTISEDGSHVVVSSMVTTLTPNGDGSVTASSHMAPAITTINAVTGAQSVRSITGLSSVGFNGDGTHIVAVTDAGLDSVVSIFDADSGDQVGSSVNVAGKSGTWRTGAGYAALFTTVGDATTNTSVFNLSNGAQIGKSVQVAADITNVNGILTPNMTSDGSHAVVLASDPGGAQTSVTLLTLALTSNNHAPTIGTINVGQPDSISGVVSGSVSGVDADGNPLTYSIGTGPSKGSVTVNSNGTFTYTASSSQRQTIATLTDGFTINVSDGITTTVANVSVQVAPVPNQLVAGQVLHSGQFIMSTSGKYKLVMQSDGNLVIYNTQSGAALWASNTSGRPEANAVMQGDGNFVMYSGATAVWSTRTNGFSGALMVLQDDSNLVVYKGSTALWDRNAGRINTNVASSNAGSTGSSNVNVATFVSTYQGKQVGDGQCVTLVKQFLSSVFGIVPGAWGNAVDYRSGGTGGNQLAARGFAWHTDQSFRDGDIVVWDGYSKDSNGVLQRFGHVGIFAQGKIFDQNDGRHSPAMTAKFSGSFWYSNGTLGVTNGSTRYLGYWRKG